MTDLHTEKFDHLQETLSGTCEGVGGVGAVEETIGEEDEVPGVDPLPGDLLQLALPHQLPPGQYYLVVTKPRLE